MMGAVDNVEFDVQKIQTFLIGLGSGGAIGIITGAAIKHTAKRVAVALGTVFIFLQVSQFFGFVNVRWDKVTESALPILDINEDGQLTEDDLRHLVQQGMILAPDILMRGLPNVAGFATGMLVAFWFL